MLFSNPLVRLVLAPAHKVGDLQLKGRKALLQGDLLELHGCFRQLLHQHGDEGGIHRQVALALCPGGEPLGIRQRFAVAGGLLQATQAVGQEPQVVPLEGRQQRAFELRQIPFAQHGCSRNPQA